MSPTPFVIPDGLLRSYGRSADPAGRTWLADLPALVTAQLHRWELVTDGDPLSGEAALVLPVRRVDGSPAVLRCQPAGDESRAAVLGLRTWDGVGAVRLLDHDPDGGASLLERLATTTLAERVHSATGADARDAADDAAMEVLAGLLVRLTAVPAPPGLPDLGQVADDMLAAVPAALTALPDPDDAALLATCAAALRELRGEPGDRLLHWDLHYGNVLAADREPWLAIDPVPLSGDPGFDVWPALDTEWDTLVAPADDPLRVVDRRFDLLTDALGLDRDRVAGWTLGRVLQNCLWDVEDGEDGEVRLAANQVAVAKAMLRRPR